MEEILDRLEEMQRAQMRSNSRIVRAVICASIASQATLFLVLINSASIITAVLGVVVNVVAALGIRAVARTEGRREWPREELETYE